MTSDTHFSGPEDFLKVIRTAHERPLSFADPWDTEFGRITGEELKHHGLELSSQRESFSIIMNELLVEAFMFYSPDQRQSIQNYCAIGALDLPTVEAFCAKSPEGYFAIVVSHGLMGFIHKYLKLTIGVVSPHSVVYCNRKAANQVTRDDLLSYAAELISHYQQSGDTRGAMVKLSDQLTAQVGLAVHLCESFVLGHEIGHFLAGHLLRDAHFSSDLTHPWLSIFRENQSHMDEMEADTYGFELMQFASSQRGKLDKTESERALLFATLAVFEALHVTGPPVGTDTHPAPFDRALAVIKKYLSPAAFHTAEKWIQTGVFEPR